MNHQNHFVLPSLRQAAVLLSLVVFFRGSSLAAQASVTPATPGVCYASTGKKDGGRFLTIDLATGAATLVGSTGVAGMSGLAIDTHGRIYGTNPGISSNLYRIDAATGLATMVGSTLLAGVDGLAFGPDNVLYASESFNADSLYRLDPDTGAATFIGLFGVKSDEDEILGMAYDPATGKMFGSAGGHSDNIYTIDLKTGAATLLGSTELGGGVPDLVVDLTGNLFGTNGTDMTSNFTLISIDKTTGRGTTIGPTGFGSVSGLALFDPSRARRHAIHLPLSDMPDALNGIYSVAEEEVLTAAAPGVLSSSSEKTAKIVSYGGVTGGEESRIGVATRTEHGGSVVLLADGSFIYNPANGFTGDDSFKYTLAAVDECSTGTITITVAGIGEIGTSRCSTR